MGNRPLQSVLVTGAAGFVGSTLVRRLLQDGTRVVGLDDLSRGHADSLPAHVALVQGDVRDPEAVREALNLLGGRPEAVIHLASLILVGESVAKPDWYMSVNSAGTQVVTDACVAAGVPSLVLASSAAVLSSQQGDAIVLDETATVAPESPYGESKWQSEQTLQAASQTGQISTTALRLFNVAGAAHGCAERHDPESHLIPLAIRAAWGELPALQVFGTDLPTPDGTCLRDYVHIADVVEAMVRSAVRGRDRTAAGDAGHEVFHVGSGQGHSVRQVIETVEEVLGIPVPRRDAPRRAGDVPSLVCEPSKLRSTLQIRPSTDLLAMVRDCAAALRSVRPDQLA